AVNKDGTIQLNHLPEEAQHKLRECVQILGEAGFGTEGPELETTFAEIEDFGHESGRLLARLLQQALAEHHAQHFQQERAACPRCQTDSPVKESAGERDFKTRDGDVPLAELVYHCPDCNRDFFPSTHPVED
ncbi:MAG: hypothetical protein N2C14_03600, partial [Planctomycetales bacterium]